jgi:hypothetical protein
MPDENPTPDWRVTDHAILGLISDPDAQRPWSFDEIAREMGDRGATTDCLASLHGAGLVHRCGEFVWTTRAAMRADELSL